MVEFLVGDPDWWVRRCERCGGTGWWYDPYAGMKACFECDAPQLSVTAKPCNLGDAWPVDVTVSVERVL